MQNRILKLVISLILNSVGNALAISTCLGAVIWTAAGEGVAAIIQQSIGLSLTLFGVMIIVVCCILKKKIEWVKEAGNFIFMLVFSYIIEFCTKGFVSIGVPNLPIVVRVFLNLLAVILIAAAVALYQQANLVMHPNDELMFLIRKRVKNGNAIVAQFIAYVFPVTLTVSAFLLKGSWFAIGIGTLISFLFQGFFVEQTDKVIAFFSQKSIESEKKTSRI